MDKQYLLTLLRKYQQGNVTKEEQQLLERYYNLFENEPDIMGLLSADENKELKDTIRHNIWNTIAKYEQPVGKIRSLNGRFLKTAAVAAVFIGIISSLYFLNNLTRGKQNQAKVALQPPGKKPLQHANAAAALHQKENRVIFLPDGSKVILSPGSKLNYPSSFDGMLKREVFLYGQAFFDIKHNTARPFVVHTGKLETIVLGTAFNIKAFAGENNITITVKRGKVKVNNENKLIGIITPNQQIVYSKQEVSANLKVVDDDSYLDWKNQDLFIDNLTLSEAAKILEDRYKIKIVISDSSLREQRFTATFQKDEKLEEALMSISVFNGVDYTYSAQKSLVYIKGK